MIVKEYLDHFLVHFAHLITIIASYTTKVFVFMCCILDLPPMQTMVVVAADNTISGHKIMTSSPGPCCCCADVERS